MPFFSSVNMESFIEAVRVRPCLWHPQHSEYRDCSLKDDAWQQVVEQIRMKNIPSIQVAKFEWKKLRDNHRDALKRAKLGKNKLLPAQITTWKYAKAMQFLEPHMKYRITEHIEAEPPHSQNSSDYDVSTSDVVSQQDANESYSKKRPRQEQSDGLAVRMRPTKNDSDALESFFTCMLQSTREMPQWMQTQVKKKMFAVIIEAEEVLHYQSQPSDSRHSIREQLQIDDMCKVEVKAELITDD